MADQQAGWYPDPSGDTTKLRYWDGNQWTNDFTDAQQVAQPVEQVQVAEQVQPQPVQQVQPVEQAMPLPVQPAQPIQQVQQVQPQVMPGSAYSNSTGAQPSPTYMQAPPAPQSNGLAIAALICGIVGLCIGPVSIVGIITGVMGRKNPYNRGMATAGMIIGIIGAVGWLFYLIFIFVLAFANL